MPSALIVQCLPKQDKNLSHFTLKKILHILIPKNLATGDGTEVWPLFTFSTSGKVDFGNLYKVETHIKELRFFLSSLDRFLISGFVVSIPACKDLNKDLIYSTCLACIYTVCRTRIPDDS